MTAQGAGGFLLSFWEGGIVKRSLIAAGLLLCMNLAYGMHNSEHVYQIDDDTMGKWRRQQEDQRREDGAERRHREQMQQREYLEEQRRRDEAFRAQQERDRQQQQRQYDRFWKR
jgi:hypothetical protein